MGLKSRIIGHTKQGQTLGNSGPQTSSQSSAGSITIYVNPPLAAYSSVKHTSALKITTQTSTTVMKVLLIAHRHFGLDDPAARKGVYVLHKAKRPLAGTVANYAGEGGVGIDSVLTKDPLDSSKTLSGAGVAQGSRLFIVRRTIPDQTVRVALQIMQKDHTVKNIPDTGRVILQASSLLTLWGLLKKADGDLGTSLTSSHTKKGEFMMPKLIYQNAEFSEADQLSTIRLATLISASATNGSSNSRLAGRPKPSSSSSANNSLMFRVVFAPVEESVKEYLEKYGEGSLIAAQDDTVIEQDVVVQEDSQEIVEEQQTAAPVIEHAQMETILSEPTEKVEEIEMQTKEQVDEMQMDIASPEDIKMDIPDLSKEYTPKEVIEERISGAITQSEPEQEESMNVEENLVLQQIIPAARDLPDSFYTLQAADMDSIKPRRSALDTSFKSREKVVEPSRAQLEGEKYKIKIVFPCGTFIILESLKGKDSLAIIISKVTNRFPYLPPMVLVTSPPSATIIAKSTIDERNDSLIWTYPSNVIGQDTKLMNMKLGSQFTLRLNLGDISALKHDSTSELSRLRLKTIDLKKGKWVGFSGNLAEAETIKVTNETPIAVSSYPETTTAEKTERSEDATEDRSPKEPRIIGTFPTKKTTEKKVPKWLKPFGN